MPCLRPCANRRILSERWIAAKAGNISHTTGFIMRPFFSLVLTGVLFPIPAFAMPLPDCAGTVEVAHAHIVRVEKNGALILSDGRAMLLEGIRLPGADRPGDAIAEEALDTLRELSMKEALTLTSTPPKEDRYD